jgi:hypothetical protein
MRLMLRTKICREIIPKHAIDYLLSDGGSYPFVDLNTDGALVDQVFFKPVY